MSQQPLTAQKPIATIAVGRSGSSRCGKDDGVGGSAPEHFIHENLAPLRGSLELGLWSLTWDRAQESVISLLPSHTPVIPWGKLQGSWLCQQGGHLCDYICP